MVSGYLLMFLYTVLMLGNVNRIEHRTYLTAAGITAVILGLVVSIGLGALMNLPYTPMHAILPFLCLGKIQVNPRLTILPEKCNLSKINL